METKRYLLVEDNLNDVEMTWCALADSPPEPLHRQSGAAVRFWAEAPPALKLMPGLNPQKTPMG